MQVVGLPVVGFCMLHSFGDYGHSRQPNTSSLLGQLQRHALREGGLRDPG